MTRKNGEANETEPNTSSSQMLNHSLRYEGTSHHENDKVQFVI